MKQVISLLILALFCSFAVLADDKVESKTEVQSEDEAAVQSGRIVNGIAVSIANYKFALSLHLDGRFFCGGSVITVSHVLTAGHCVYPIRSTPSRVSIRGGSTSATTGGFLFPALRITVHPSYNPNASPGTSDFDAAIINVANGAFRGRANMAPIALGTSEVPVGGRCYVVGWGRTNINSPAPTSGLRYANMAVVSQRTCASMWAAYRYQPITSNMICAKYSNGVDVCKGDSGGAFVCGGRLSGIVSFTNPDCNSAWPAGFAKVIAPSIRSFIRTQTGI